MTQWPTVKARKLPKGLESLGWTVVRQRGSHRIMSKEGWVDIIFAFHDNEEIEPKMLSKISKNTGLRPEDL